MINLIRDYCDKIRLYHEGPSITDEKGYIYGDFLTAYTYASGFAKNKIVLDVGCGIGYGSNFIANNGAEKVVGLDHSKKAISIANEKYCRDNLNFEIGSGTTIAFEDNFFDMIVAFEIIEHIEDDFVFLLEIKRVLKDGGMLFISTPNKKISSANKKRPPNPLHIREYLPEEFIDLIGRHFKIEKKYGIFLVNQSAKKEQIKLQSSLRWKLASWLGSYRFIKKITMNFPPKITRFISGENTTNHPIYTDYSFNNNYSNSNRLVLQCRK